MTSQKDKRRKRDESFGNGKKRQVMTKKRKEKDKLKRTKELEKIRLCDKGVL